MQGNILGQNNSSSNSNLKINGIIEEYTVASGGNVNAGDFVKFINNFTVNEDTKLSTAAGTGGVISAIQLTDNKVFIAHIDNYHLYGMIVTINKDNSITVGTDTKLSTAADTGIRISTVKITDNKIFIAHNYNGSDNYLYGMLLDNLLTIDKASNKSANILGVSNTSGTEGQTVQVYVPSI